MKNSTLLVIIAILIIAVGGFVFVKAKNSENSNLVVNDLPVLEGDLQRVTLSMKDYNYYPQTLKVKAGSPVEITLDDSVYGCFRAFSLRDFGINKYSKNPSEKIVFTPEKKGTFTFSCTMGMGYGKIIVE